MPPTAATAEQLDRVRSDLHNVQVGLGERLAVVETQTQGTRDDLKVYREQSEARHREVLAGMDGFRRTVDRLCFELSDQGRTPPPPPSLPPGPALPTLAPVERDREPSSDPGAITLSPRRIGPWLRMAWPYILTVALSVGGLKGCEAMNLRPLPADTEEAP